MMLAVLLVLLLLDAGAHDLAVLRDLVLLVPHHRVLSAAAVGAIAITAVHDDQVAPGANLDDVVAAAWLDRVVPVGALDAIGLVAADDLLAALVRAVTLGQGLDANRHHRAGDVVVAAGRHQLVRARV